MDVTIIAHQRQVFVATAQAVSQGTTFNCSIYHLAASDGHN